MSDLISRQALCEYALNQKDKSVTPNDIMRFPPAQPEIIRCKDCGHWDTTWQNDFAPNYHYCPLVDGTRSGDFYCADAERRR